MSTIKAWLDLALALKVTLIVDLNEATPDKSVAGGLVELFNSAAKQGLATVIINQDEGWKTFRTYAQAFELIGTPEAKAIQQVMVLDKTVRENATQGPKTEEQLEEILALYGKDMKTLEEMQPNDLMKLNKKVKDRLEYLLAVYTEGIMTLKSTVGMLSKQSVSPDSMNGSDIAKAQVLAFLKQKGLG